MNAVKLDKIRKRKGFLKNFQKTVDKQLNNCYNIIPC